MRRTVHVPAITWLQSREVDKYLSRLDQPFFFEARREARDPKRGRRRMQVREKAGDGTYVIGPTRLSALFLAFVLPPVRELPQPQLEASFLGLQDGAS